jgi:hypothetical protein
MPESVSSAQQTAVERAEQETKGAYQKEWNY